MELELKKPKLRCGESFEKGYYFKDKFLSRYKTESLQILRKRVEDLPEEERNKTDEWKVIREEFLKMTDKTKKTTLKKQPFYNKIHKRALEHSLVTLKQRLEWKKTRKNEIIKELDAGLDKIRNQIIELEGNIKEVELKCLTTQ